jgi:periplasmic copper chaperone A
VSLRIQSFASHVLIGSVGFLVSICSVGVHAKDHKPTEAAVMAAASQPVQISGAWIRAAVKGQSGTGGFMTLTSAKAATLVGFTSTVAKANQLHQMVMDGDVMRMSEIKAIDMPAGQAVELKPGGNHIMLMGLKNALNVGDTVKLTLKFKDASGKPFTQKVEVPVQLPGVQAKPAKADEHKGHDHADHKH